jgi:hypothetical protein
LCRRRCHKNRAGQTSARGYHVGTLNSTG